MVDEGSTRRLREHASMADSPEKRMAESVAPLRSLTPREERVIAGFEDIQRFAQRHGRAPRHGEDRDIFERLYAVRLDRLRALEECRALLDPLDHQGLLADAAPAPADLDRKGVAE
jgi:hypothetical protein